MKKLKHFSWTWCLASVLALAACSKDGGEEPPTPPTPPTPPGPVELVNAMLFGETKTDLKSMFSLEQEGMFYVYVSPEEVASIEELTATGDDGETPLHQYVMVAVEQSLLGTTIDAAKGGDAYFALFNMTSTREEFESVDADNPSAVKAGTIRVEKDAEAKTVALEFDLTLPLDKTFAAKASFPLAEPVGPAIENGYKIDGEGDAFRSIAVMEDYGYIYVIMTPVEGVDGDFDAIYEQEEYLMLLVDPSVVGTTVDLMNPEAPMWTIDAAFAALPEPIMIDPEYAGESISAGQMTVAQQNKSLTVTATMTLLDGKEFEFSVGAEYEPGKLPENYLKIESDVAEIQSAFYEDTTDGSAVYLTTSDISDATYPSELFFDCRHTVVMKLKDNLMLGDDWDIADATGFEFEFRFDYGDMNPNGEGYVHIVKAGEINGESGTFNVVKSGSTEGKFTVSFDFNLGDRFVKGVYTGVCLPYRVEKKNEYGEPGGVKKPIGSVLVNYSENPCEIWLASETGLMTPDEFAGASDPVKILLPESEFTGDPVGFSTCPEFAVIYGGTTYNSANGNLGTISVKVENLHLTLDLSLKRDIEDSGMIETFFEGYYEGEVLCVSKPF